TLLGQERREGQERQEGRALIRIFNSESFPFPPFQPFTPFLPCTMSRRDQVRALALARSVSEIPHPELPAASRRDAGGRSDRRRRADGLCDGVRVLGGGARRRPARSRSHWPRRLVCFLRVDRDRAWHSIRAAGEDRWPAIRAAGLAIVAAGGARFCGADSAA